VHAATLTDGSVQLCCVSKADSGFNLNQHTLEDYWNSDYMKTTRQKMLAGEKVTACMRCYEEEKNGYRSHRVVENEVWERKLGETRINDLVLSTQPNGQLDKGLLSIDLRLGNTCNLQCIMCQPRESSRWLVNAKKLGQTLNDRDLINEWNHKSRIQVDRFEWYKNTEFWKSLENFVPDLREIIMGGGEPLLIAEQAEFMKKCSESGEAKHIQMRYHTNGTIIPDGLIAHWENFESVEMFVSLDGYGDVASYVRYPTKWNEVEKNLHRFDTMSDTIRLKFLYSVHALNIYHIPDFLRWVKAENFKKKNGVGIQFFVHPGLVHWPLYLNVKALPKQLKGIVAKRLIEVKEEFPDDEFDKYESLITFMNSEQWDHMTPKLVDYINGLDSVRRTNFKQTFPALVQYFNGVK
jgi:pyruvate-formate lyase-activating enzyme